MKINHASVNATRVRRGERIYLYHHDNEFFHLVTGRTTIIIKW